MIFQNLMKKEIKIYRLVFLFYPLLGCVYWYLSRHVPMRSILHTAHGADVPISIIMGWLMLPGYILSFCMYKLLCIAIRDLRCSEEFVCFLFLASQTMIGYLCSRIVKLLTGEERLLLRKPRIKGVAERVAQNVQGKNQNEHEKCRTSDLPPDTAP